MTHKTYTVACGITTVLLLLLYVIPGAAVAQTSAEPQSTSAPPPHAAIRVEEVATQATEVAKLLRTWSAQGAPSPAIDTIHQVLPEVSGTIDLKLAATSTLLQGQPTLEALQTQEQFWQRRHLQTTGWLHALTERATYLQEVGQRLAALHTTWTATRTAAQQTQAPAPILQQIDATLAALATAQTPLEAQRTAVLDLQSRVAHEVARCEDVRTQITQVQQQAVTGMLGRDGLPLWRADFWTGVRTALPERVRQVMVTYGAEILHYLREPAAGLPLHAGLFVFLALAFGAMRRQVQRWQVAGEAVASALLVFQHPYAAALLSVLFIVTSPWLPLPLAVREGFQLLAYVQILRLTRPIVAAP